jgi:hypothetical protein
VGSQGLLRHFETSWDIPIVVVKKKLGKYAYI